MEITLKCDCGNEEKIKLQEEMPQDDIGTKFNITCYDGYSHILCTECNKKIEIYG